MYTKKEAKEMETMTEMIHKNSIDRELERKQRIKQNRRNEIFTNICVSVSTVFFFMILLYVINAIENLEFTWSLF